MILAIFLSLVFGMLIGMVLNHAIEEAERRRNETERLREVIRQLEQEGWGNG